MCIGIVLNFLDSIPLCCCILIPCLCPLSVVGGTGNGGSGVCNAGTSAVVTTDVSLCMCTIRLLHVYEGCLFI